MISVVITTYKREMSVLKRAIETVRNQTELDVELIVVNDYPPFDEKIRELLNGYGDIIYCSHEKQEGACKARNDGLKLANGEYIAFLDDDDEWTADKLSKQKQVMMETFADFVYCSGVIFNDCTADQSSMDFIHDCKTGEHLKTLLYGNFMGGCSFPLIKKEVLLSLKGFDTDMPSSQDYELWIRIADAYKIAYIDEPLVIYHVGNEAITSNPEKRIAGFCMLYRKHQALFQKYPDAAMEFYKKMVWTSVFTGRKDLLPSVENTIALNFMNRMSLKYYTMITRAKYMINRKSRNF